MSAAPPPFFIVGSPRSGTTLLQVLLDAHPDVAIPPESHIYRVFMPLMARYGDLAERGNRLRLANDLVAHVWVRPWGLDVTGRQLVDEATRPGRAGLVDALLRRYAAAHGASRWGEKTPYHVSYLAAIFEDFPEARVIHLVRDGRDVLESRRRVVWGPKSALGVARQWRGHLNDCRGYFGPACDPRLLELRYCDLVADPKAHVLRLQEFLGLRPVDTTELAAQSPLARRMVQTESHHQGLAAGVNRSKVGAFRQSLSPRDVELFEWVAGVELERFGYGRLFAQPRPPRAWEWLHAWYQDHPRRFAVKYLREPRYLPMVLSRQLHRLRVAVRPRRWAGDSAEKHPLISP